MSLESVPSLLKIFRSTIFGIIRLGYVAKTFYGKHPRPSPFKYCVLSRPDLCLLLLGNEHPTAFFHPTFTNKTGTAPGFWTTAEVSIGVVTACLPPLGPLIRRTPSPKQLYYSIRGSPSVRLREDYGMEKLKGSELEHKGKEGGVIALPMSNES